MTRRRKPNDDTPVLHETPASPFQHRPFEEALKAKTAEPPAARAKPVSPKPIPPPSPPPPPVSREDDTLRRRVYEGVEPLRGRAARHPRHTSPHAGDARLPERRARPTPSIEDERVRDELANLVAGGVRFEVVWNGDDELTAVRIGADRSVLRTLRSATSPERTLDLHGLTTAEAERELTRFVRREQSSGTRLVCVIHGKGLHSEGGVPVLRDHVLKCLIDGVLAAYVVGIATAHPRLGGTGALMIALVTRR